MFSRFASLISFSAMAALSNAGVFTLNANAQVHNTNDGFTFIGDPRTATIDGPGSAAIDSASAIVGISATERVSAQVFDELSGTITFDASWNATSIAAGQVRFWSISYYDFTMSDPGTLHVDWTSSVSSTGDNVDAFGIQDVYLYVDGTQYTPPFVFPAPPSGVWDIALEAGSHSVGFQNFSNIQGGLGTQTASLHETLNFNVQPVPEPATFAAVGLGLAALVRKRRRG